jgi:hypothetical protein
MDEKIGATAGQVWEYLYKNGPVTAIKLKSALGVSNSSLCLALGWLAREDKIEVSETDHSFKVSLKQ